MDDDDLPERPDRLGLLLTLLHNAPILESRIHAEYRVWRRIGSAVDGVRSGVTTFTGGAVTFGGREAEQEEFARVWRFGREVRLERSVGERDVFLGVRTGDRSWSWTEGGGITTDSAASAVAARMGAHVTVATNPGSLMGALRFSVRGAAEVLGRKTISATASPRESPTDEPLLGAHSCLGRGADEYQLQVDAETGVLLDVMALRSGTGFQQMRALEFAVDEPISAERFHFRPPFGSDTYAPAPPQPEIVSLSEAQRRAPFALLVPDPKPAEWTHDCAFVGASSVPRWPHQVSITLSSDGGYEAVTLLEAAAAEGSSPWAEQLRRGKEWETVYRNGAEIVVMKADKRGLQVQAYVERYGTLVFLTSATSSQDQLTSLAARLEPLLRSGTA